MIRIALLTSFLTVTALRVQAQNDLRYFMGDWDFRSWGTQDISSPPALSGTWHLEDGLDSALALVGRVVLDDGSNAQGGPFTRELIAFDGYAKVYTRTIVTNAGSSYLFHSAGWKSDRLTWTGTQHSVTGEVELREEIERTGPDSFTAVFYGKDGDSWVLQSNERLVRKGR